jgi:hypothetical protein
MAMPYRGLLPILLSLACTYAARSGRAQEAGARTAGPVKFLEYKEVGRWRTWTDGYLSLRVPLDWSVTQDTKRSTESEFFYTVRNARGTELFEAQVVEGGPEFIGCFCAPQSKYEYSLQEPYKIWAFTLKDGTSTTCTFKVANQHLRLDIHADLSSDEDGKLRYAVETARVDR